MARGSRSSSTKQRLEQYRDKRDFARTAEPAGAGEVASAAGGANGARRFVVQRHRARQLHYDFRLEIDGVLVSWAVPKGPTLDANVRRGAYHVEDHPIEYIDFEGVIPSGEYGGGDVIVWDAGTWTPVKPDEIADPGAALDRGELHVVMDGAKLRGQFVLVRTRNEASGRDSWLLLHKHDEFAVKGWDPEQHPKSVLSGRTNDEVQADPDRLWRSDLPAAQAAIPLRADAVAAVDDDALAALDALDASGSWHVFGRTVRLTDLDAELFPRRGRGRPVTKRELVRYAAQIAPVVQPYLSRRALTVHRFPSGADGTGSWSRDLPARAPDWLPRWTDHEDGGSTRLVVDEPAALVWAANRAALEWHASTARVDDPDEPSHAVVDIGGGARVRWADVLTLARLYRTALDHLGVHGRPKLSGHGGIEIWVPVAGASRAEVDAWVEQLHRSVDAVVPDLARADQRDGPAPRRAVLVPYSPCAAAGAPVSAPIDWDEFDDPHLRRDRFTVRTIGDRIAERGDLFDAVLRSPQRLPRLG